MVDDIARICRNCHWVCGKDDKFCPQCQTRVRFLKKNESNKFGENGLKRPNRRIYRRYIDPAIKNAPSPIRTDIHEVIPPFEQEKKENTNIDGMIPPFKQNTSVRTNNYNVVSLVRQVIELTIGQPVDSLPHLNENIVDNSLIDENIEKAIELEKKGKFEQAESVYQESLKINSNYKKLLFEYGQFLFQRSQYAKAEIFLNKCIDLDQKNSFAFVYLEYSQQEKSSKYN